VTTFSAVACVKCEWLVYWCSKLHLRALAARFHAHSVYVDVVVVVVAWFAVAGLMMSVNKFSSRFIPIKVDSGHFQLPSTYRNYFVFC